MFEKGDIVIVDNLGMQSFVESHGLHDINSEQNTVGWRQREDRNTVGGLYTNIGKKGEIYRHLDYLDSRFDNKWYSVYLKMSLATYSWFNFHESELKLVASFNPLSNWLKN